MKDQIAFFFPLFGPSRPWGRPLPFALLLVFSLSLPLSLLAQEERALTLQQVVSQILAVHPVTQAARARVQAALGMVRQARAYANPSFTFTNNEAAEDGERTYTFTQPLEWPFKRTYRIGVAETEGQIAEEEQNGARQEVIAAAREAFFSALLAQEGSRVAEAFVETTQQLQRSTQKLFQEGDIAEFEVIKAGVEAMRAQTDLEKARGQLKTALAGLNLLLGNTEDSPLALAGSLLPLPAVRPLAQLFLLAEEQNPLLTAQRRVVERERLNLKLAWAALVPDLSIEAGPATGGEGIGPLVGFTMPFPLWDRKEGAITAARSKVAEAEATLRATQLQVRQALLKAYRSWEVARRQADAFAKGLVVQAEQAAALAEQSYREGEGDLLGVLDAERSLLGVRRDYAQALFDTQLAWVAVEQAAGIGTDQ